MLLVIKNIHTGIIADPSASLFTYDARGTWKTFYKPDYRPIFEVKFTDPELEEKAQEVTVYQCL